MYILREREILHFPGQISDFLKDLCKFPAIVRRFFFEILTIYFDPITINLSLVPLIYIKYIFF
jgi:hypothetical protein